MGWFGASVKRKEDPVLLTGRGRYVDDIALPGMLHAAVLRSPYAHALIRDIDKRAALALPGVRASRCPPSPIVWRRSPMAHRRRIAARLQI